jgi:hypothetical protein
MFIDQKFWAFFGFLFFLFGSFALIVAFMVKSVMALSRYKEKETDTVTLRLSMSKKTYEKLLEAKLLEDDDIEKITRNSFHFWYVITQAVQKGLQPQIFINNKTISIFMPEDEAKEWEVQHRRSQFRVVKDDDEPKDS